MVLRGCNTDTRECFSISKFYENVSRAQRLKVTLNLIGQPITSFEVVVHRLKIGVLLHSSDGYIVSSANKRGSL